ncbi:hypothetical protein HK102_006791 [Quaeritorhiza haematococci]|nr:hypothetical protein HK102_006791 [Quaeritorhiza haematococci]
MEVNSDERRDTVNDDTEAGSDEGSDSELTVRAFADKEENEEHDSTDGSEEDGESNENVLMGLWQDILALEDVLRVMVPNAYENSLEEADDDVESAIEENTNEYMESSDNISEDLTVTNDDDSNADDIHFGTLENDTSPQRIGTVRLDNRSTSSPTSGDDDVEQETQEAEDIRNHAAETASDADRMEALRLQLECERLQLDLALQNDERARAEEQLRYLQAQKEELNMMKRVFDALLGGRGLEALDIGEGLEEEDEAVEMGEGGRVNENDEEDSTAENGRHEKREDVTPEDVRGRSDGVNPDVAGEGTNRGSGALANEVDGRCKTLDALSGPAKNAEMEGGSSSATILATDCTITEGLSPKEITEFQQVFEQLQQQERQLAGLRDHIRMLRDLAAEADSLVEGKDADGSSASLPSSPRTAIWIGANGDDTERKENEEQKSGHNYDNKTETRVENAENASASSTSGTANVSASEQKHDGHIVVVTDARATASSTKDDRIDAQTGLDEEAESWMVDMEHIFNSIESKQQEMRGTLLKDRGSVSSLGAKEKDSGKKEREENEKQGVQEGNHVNCNHDDKVEPQDKTEEDKRASDGVGDAVIDDLMYRLYAASVPSAETKLLSNAKSVVIGGSNGGLGPSSSGGGDVGDAAVTAKKGVHSGKFRWKSAAVEVEFDEKDGVFGTAATLGVDVVVDGNAHGEELVECEAPKSDGEVESEEGEDSEGKNVDATRLDSEMKEIINQLAILKLYEEELQKRQEQKGEEEGDKREGGLWESLSLVALARLKLLSQLREMQTLQGTSDPWDCIPLSLPFSNKAQMLYKDILLQDQRQKAEEGTNSVALPWQPQTADQRIVLEPETLMEHDEKKPEHKGTSNQKVCGEAKEAEKVDDRLSSGLIASAAEAEPASSLKSKPHAKLASESVALGPVLGRTQLKGKDKETVDNERDGSARLHQLEANQRQEVGSLFRSRKKHTEKLVPSKPTAETLRLDSIVAALATTTNVSSIGTKSGIGNRNRYFPITGNEESGAFDEALFAGKRSMSTHQGQTNHDQAKEDDLKGVDKHDDTESLGVMSWVEHATVDEVSVAEEDTVDKVSDHLDDGGDYSRHQFGGSDVEIGKALTTQKGGGKREKKEVTSTKPNGDGNEHDGAGARYRGRWTTTKDDSGKQRDVGNVGGVAVALSCNIHEEIPPHRLRNDSFRDQDSIGSQGGTVSPNGYVMMEGMGKGRRTGGSGPQPGLVDRDHVVGGTQESESERNINGDRRREHTAEGDIVNARSRMNGNELGRNPSPRFPVEERAGTMEPVTSQVSSISSRYYWRKCAEGDDNDDSYAEVRMDEEDEVDDVASMCMSSDSAALDEMLAKAWMRESIMDDLSQGARENDRKRKIGLGTRRDGKKNGVEFGGDKKPNSQSRSRAGRKTTRYGFNATAEENDDDVKTKRLFKSVKDQIYRGAANIISQHEDEPYFLLQLFRGVNKLNTRYLRQKFMIALDDILHEDENGDSEEEEIDEKTKRSGGEESGSDDDDKDMDDYDASIGDRIGSVGRPGSGMPDYWTGLIDEDGAGAGGGGRSAVDGMALDSGREEDEDKSVLKETEDMQEDAEEASTHSTRAPWIVVIVNISPGTAALASLLALDIRFSVATIGLAKEESMGFLDAILRCLNMVLIVVIVMVQREVPRVAVAAPSGTLG